MSPRTKARLAWSVCGLTLALMAVSLLLYPRGASAAALPGDFSPWREQAILVLGVAGAPVLGALISSRRPENRYGWLWLGVGLAFALLSFGWGYGAYAIANPGTLPAYRTVSVIAGDLGWISQVTLMPFILLLFPTGRLPSRRWRFVAWSVLAAGVLTLVVGVFQPDSGVVDVENPFGLGGVGGQVVMGITLLSVFVIFLGIILSAGSLFFRYRWASGVERQQIKWFAYAAVVFGAIIIFGGFLGRDLPGIWDAISESATFAVLYVAVGVAILRYRLYEIDRIINRTLVYGLLVATLAAVYVGGVAGLQYLLRALTGQEQQPQLVIVATTLLIAALFNPLRRRIQAAIDRRFYRRKYDAAKTLEAFSMKLRDKTDLEQLNRELVSVVRETMQPEHVSLWLRDPAMDKRGNDS
ncbi:MAG: hypothetical protein ACFB50_15350 [Rubrobacteraceae bacterium]